MSRSLRLLLRQVLTAARGRIRCLSLSPNLLSLACGTSDGEVFVCTGGQSTCLWGLLGHRQAIHAIAWSPTGRQFATASEDQRICAWSGETGATLWTLDACGHTLPESKVIRCPTCLLWSPNEHMVSWGDTHGHIHHWRWDTRLRGTVVSTGMGTLLDLEWSPSGRTIAVSSDTGQVCLVTPRTGRLIVLSRLPRPAVRLVRWQPGGGCVITIDDDRTLTMWCPKTKQLIGRKQLPDQLLAASFSTDGMLLGLLLQSGEFWLVRTCDWNLDFSCRCGGPDIRRGFVAFSASLLVVGTASARRIEIWGMERDSTGSRTGLQDGALKSPSTMEINNSLPSTAALGWHYGHAGRRFLGFRAETE